jgi:large subunit ribosomal protein L5e
MAFVKILKNTAFFKRYQVQKRRRLQGKTDYKARRKMVSQDKDKFNCRKYRIVVRFTRTKCICQVVYATIIGDKVVSHANSAELKKFEIPAGYTNYAAAYCTGLVLARRTLKKFGLDDTFKGKEEANGEEYHVEEEETERKPLKCILDVGLQRTCVGARMWGALKGAVDGGLHIPHNSKNFPGFAPAEEKGAESSYDAEVHKSRILGGHLKEYMEMLAEEDPTKYEAHFSRYIAADIDADKVEDMYGDAHKKIRADPEYEPTKKTVATWTRKGNNFSSSDGTEVKRSVKLSLRQRREKVRQKIAAAQAKMMEADE